MNTCHDKNTFAKCNDGVNTRRHVARATAKFPFTDSKLSALSMPICHVLVHILPLIGSPVPKLKMLPDLAQPELVVSNYTPSAMNANNDNITSAGDP